MNPGPGEVIDRLSVVSRKLVEETGTARTDHFVKEATELLEFWHNDIRCSSVKMDYVLTLAAVNAAIWQREDELRVIRKYMQEAALEATVQLAFRIQELNDQRAGLVRDINAACGIQREEKL